MSQPIEMEAARAHDTPNPYPNLGDTSSPPIRPPDEQEEPPFRPRQPSRSASAREARNILRRSHSHTEYTTPSSYTKLNEVGDPAPLQNPDEEANPTYHSLEQVRSRAAPQQPQPPSPEEKEPRISILQTRICTHAHLILFALLGTLSRLALQSLTTYPGSPTLIPSLWPNFAGALILGLLSESNTLFSSAGPQNKKTIPLYIGLATGFCGSLTSFSSFLRDAFLSISNDLTRPPVPRNGGYSLASALSVIIITLTACLSALFVGAHIALAAERVVPPRFTLPLRVFDIAAIPLACVAWLASVLLCIFPPGETWRATTFALAFAPVGCVARFWVSLKLNGRFANFPLGTFSVNMAGTMVLGMAWDLAHVPMGGVLGCQVLQGVQDGFCGCLTTVSTWVGEMAALRRGHAYVYGGVSVGVGLGVLVAVMGGLRWTLGFEELACAHSF